MNKTEKNIIGVVFLVILLFFVIYTAFIVPSGWLFDAIISIIGFFIVFLLTEKAGMGKVELILAGCLFIPNMLGAFNFYSWTYGIFAYDNIVHFVSSFIVAYLIFALFVKKYFSCLSAERKFFVNNKKLMVFAIVSIAVMLGLFIELIEFGGIFILGDRANDGTFGILNPTPETNTFTAGNITQDYADTMTDFIVNLFGAICGAVVFLIFPFKRRQLDIIRKRMKHRRRHNIERFKANRDKLKARFKKSFKKGQFKKSFQNKFKK